MKISTVLLVGAGLFLIYKAGLKFNKKNNMQKVAEPVPVNNSGTSAAGSNVIGTDVNGQPVTVSAGNIPVSNPVFPNTMFETYDTKEGALSVRTFQQA